MKQKIEASITGTASSVEAAAVDLKSNADALGLTPDWTTLEIESVEYYGIYSDPKPQVYARATCHGMVEVPE